MPPSTRQTRLKHGWRNLLGLATPDQRGRARGDRGSSRRASPGPPRVTSSWLRGDGPRALVADGGLGAPRGRRRQPGRQATLRRPTLQLQQARPARRQHHRCPPRLHQTQAQSAHRCCTLLNHLLLKILIVKPGGSGRVT